MGAWAWHERAAVFLRAAELLATTWRATLNAATMLGQSKTVFQAEIDAASELIDFWRFNPHYAQELYDEQPLSPPGMWNQLEYRPLEGFVYAVTPFNFTSIAGNLPTAPALMGNTVVWKPASTRDAQRLLHHAAARGRGPAAGRHQLRARRRRADLGHRCSTRRISPACTSPAAPRCSTACGRRSARTSAATAATRGWSARPAARTSSSRTRRPTSQALAVAIVRGGFEYQGQKCSAASRVYVPASLWPEVRDRVVAMMREIEDGRRRATSAPSWARSSIGRRSTKISGYIDDARRNATHRPGRRRDDEQGYFVEPTLVETRDPGLPADVARRSSARWSRRTSIRTRSGTRRCSLVDRTSPYALTGAVFASDRAAVRQASSALRNAAGNFYINDKPTGAVVGQQPFGGARGVGHQRQGRARS